MAPVELAPEPGGGAARRVENGYAAAAMHFRSLSRGEVLASFGGILLGLSLLMAWYSLGNEFAQLNACHGPHSSCSGWDGLSAFRYLFLLAALAPAILAWVIARGHALAWPRGELTAVVAVVALILILFRGVIDKPGSPPEEISISWGWWVALLGGVLILAGSLWRSQEAAPRRKPPGVL
jgi:uncharacterized membrane protein